MTPNRVDCFGVYGVAREVHAITGAPLGARALGRGRAGRGRGRRLDFASVTVEVPELCPRFTARVFTDVTVGPSPLWLQARLTAAGQRPINNVVDITNYVMLLTAQPLHAFDLDKVPGGALTVRAAGEGEKMTTLDGVERTLDAETVLVCDARRSHGDRRDHGRPGLRGLRGDDPGPARGRELERHQHPPHLAPARPALGGLLALREAAAPGALHAGAARSPRGCWSSSAARSWCRGRSTSPPRSPAPPTIRLRGARVEGLLGMRIDQADQAAYLERLGFGVEADGDDLQVDGPARPPLRRHPRGRPDRGGRAASTASTSTCRRRCRRWPARSAASAARSGCGAGPRTPCATSASTRSSAGASPTRARPAGCGSPPATRAPTRSCSPTRSPRSSRRCARPCSARCSTSPPATSPAAPTRVSIFESGRVYLNSRRRAERPSWSRPVDPLAGAFAGERAAPFAEPHRFAALAVGPLVEQSWRGGGEPADFFALKGVLEALAGAAGRRAGLRARGGAVPASRAARPRSRSAARRPAGSARSTRWSAGSGTSRPRSASKSTPAPLIAAASGRRRGLRGRHRPSPPPTRTWPSSSRPR